MLPERRILTMSEKCCESMSHAEHMCSLTLNGCGVESARFQRNYECSTCDDKSHAHNEICTPNIIGT
jgi:hypothetical protein